jgi:hypothetical protein
MPIDVVSPMVKAQEAFIEAVKANQSRTVDATRTVSNFLSPVSSRLPRSPLADVLPEPATVIDAQLAFVGELVSAQRDYTRQLVGAIAPAAD